MRYKYFWFWWCLSTDRRKRQGVGQEGRRKVKYETGSQARYIDREFVCISDPDI